MLVLMIWKCWKAQLPRDCWRDRLWVEDQFVLMAGNHELLYYRRLCLKELVALALWNYACSPQNSSIMAPRNENWPINKFLPYSLKTELICCRKWAFVYIFFSAFIGYIIPLTASKDFGAICHRRYVCMKKYANKKSVW